MKKQIIILIIILTPLLSRAVNIVAAEYFFDTDPGIALCTPLSVGVFSDDVNFSTTITVPVNLSPGAFHMLYVRSMDETGKWSLVERRSFYIKAQITEAEYFFDTDPGWGNLGTTPVTITPTLDSINFSVSNIPTTGLGSGYHFIWIRTRDEVGNVSLYEGKQFYIHPSVVAAEYFFDSDPGVGLGVNIPITPAVDSVVFSLNNIPTTNLNSGFHYLYVRTKDETGKWSIIEGRRFYIKSSVIAAEYFFDIDSGVGHGINIPITPGVDSIVFSESNIPTPGLSVGDHKIFVRTRDDSGKWSLYEGQTFNVCAPITLYADADGDGFGNPVVSILACTATPGYVANQTDCNDTNAAIHPGAIEICDNEIDDNCNGQIDEGCPLKLKLKVFLEGFYSGGGMMNTCVYDLWLNCAIGSNSDPSAMDTIYVRLWIPEHLSNPQPDYSGSGVLHNDGNATIIYPTAPKGTYYLDVSHRNVIETWSRLPVAWIGSSYHYDFTISQAQAYNDGVNPPMKDMGGVFAFYSGDEDQNSTVDLLDIMDTYNDASSFAFGYNDTDCNGDGSSDILDMTIIENQFSLFLFTARPF